MRGGRGRLALAALALLAGAGACPAQQPPADHSPPRALARAELCGAWHVQGQARWRHLGVLDGRLWLIGAWDEELGRVELREEAAPRERPVAPRDAAWSLTGAGLDARGPRLTLELRLGAEGELLALLRRDGREAARERWWRAGPARLQLLGTRWEEGQGATITLAVEGRPQAVRLRVLAGDDPRYADLGGLVHEVALAEGQPLPVGAWSLTWDGRDRSTERRPLGPGRYRVELAPLEVGLGAPGWASAGEERPDVVAPAGSLALELQVGPAPAPPVRGAVQALTIPAGEPSPVGGALEPAGPPPAASAPTGPAPGAPAAQDPF